MPISITNNIDRIDMNKTHWWFDLRGQYILRDIKNHQLTFSVAENQEAMTIILQRTYQQPYLNFLECIKKWPT